MNCFCYEKSGYAWHKATRGTLYLPKNGLWLDNETVDNTAQTMLLALISVKATETSETGGLEEL